MCHGICPHLGLVTLGLRESGCKFALYPPTVHRKTQICTLIHTNLESTIPRLDMSHVVCLRKVFFSAAILNRISPLDHPFRRLFEMGQSSSVRAPSSRYAEQRRTRQEAGGGGKKARFGGGGGCGGAAAVALHPPLLTPKAIVSEAASWNPPKRKSLVKLILQPFLSDLGLQNETFQSQKFASATLWHLESSSKILLRHYPPRDLQVPYKLMSVRSPVIDRLHAFDAIHVACELRTAF